MKHIFFSLSCVFTLYACSKENQNIPETSLPAAKADSVVAISSSHLKLDTFGFPPEVEGCACYFSINKEDFENEKYIYIDDYGNNAFLSINGEKIKIPMAEGDFDPEFFKRTLHSGDYTVQIDGKKIKELDEVMMFTGSMTVTAKDGSKTTTPIYGECGC